MANGIHFSNGIKDRGTLNPRTDGLVHVKYVTGGDAWEKPLVAQMAAERGLLKKDDQKMKKK